MNFTLSHLRSKRSWLVLDFVVYGEWNANSLHLLYSQIQATSKRIVFENITLGGLEQSVNFSSLFDYKGNQVPAQISNPKVIVLQKNEVSCLVVGKETNSSFKIAKVTQSLNPGLVDLWIVEMG